MVEPNVVGHNTAKWLFDSTTMEMMSLAKDPASSTIGSLNTSDGTYAVSYTHLTLPTKRIV